MFKFVFSNENVFLRFHNLPLGKYFFLFNIKNFPASKNPRVKEIFLSQVILPNKTLKSTAGARFEDLDKTAVKYLNHPNESAIHDIAVSDGLSSIEFFKAISGVRNDFNFYISDKFSKFYVSPNCITRVYTADYSLMHFYLFNLIYADNKISNYFFLSKLLFYILKLISARFIPAKKQMQEIRLYDPQVIAILQSGKIYELEYDILSSRIDQKFTFVRAMNILNRVYFNEDEILQALNNIMYSLKEKGILLTGRTIKGVNNATFYQKIDSRFEILETLNNGSDIDGLVTRFNVMSLE
jgi:hypothetical protein